MQFWKKQFAFLLALLLFISAIPLQSFASGNSTIITDLVDGLVTKSDRLTFDVWAKDDTGQKVDGSLLHVTNNDALVPINWDDTEKTSYTLSLVEGINTVEIAYGLTKKAYTITRQPAADGEVIGHYTFSLDASTIGLGYLIEPIVLPIIKGRNAAEELHAVLSDNGFTYTFTGTLRNNFYLSSINKETLFEKAPTIPASLKAALQDVYDEQDYSVATGLGEFDINYMSGWMYTVNNIFPNVGFADKYLLDGDVMRVQFTLAYGQDIGGGSSMADGLGGDYFEKVNKDALTKKVAGINTEGKETYLINKPRIDAYNEAVYALTSVDASEMTLQAALQKLTQADAVTENDGTSYEEESDLHEQPVVVAPETPEQLQEKEHKAAANRVQSQIQTLPITIRATDKVAITEARTAYDALAHEAQAYVTNYSKLVEAEAAFAQLEANEESIAALEAAITKLPADVTLAHVQIVEALRAQYNAFTTAQQQRITNYARLVNAESTIASLKAIQQVIARIEQLPITITLDAQLQVQQARAAYDALTSDEQQQVTVYTTLVAAENKLAQLQQQAENVQQVEQLIHSLPETITEENRQIVERIEALYDALTTDEQQQVTNYAKLQAALNVLQENELANKIEGDTAYIAINNAQLTKTFDTAQLQAILNNEEVQHIAFTALNGMVLRLEKQALKQHVQHKDNFTVEMKIVSIGQKYLLTVTLRTDKDIILPVTFTVPVTVWHGGWLVRHVDNTFAAVRQTEQHNALTAELMTSQAYTYTNELVTFTDVAAHYSRPEVEYLASRYVIQGDNGLFSPNRNITRAQFAAMIARALQVTPTKPTAFADIKGKWYEADVQALQELGIINGVTPTSFNPNAPLTRQHAAIMMARVLRYAHVDMTNDVMTRYEDDARINRQYVADIYWLQQLDIMTGSNNVFNPTNALTRGQMAKILKRTLAIATIL